jgi:hypothetical protein
MKSPQPLDPEPVFIEGRATIAAAWRTSIHRGGGNESGSIPASGLESSMCGLCESAF